MRLHIIQLPVLAGALLLGLTACGTLDAISKYDSAVDVGDDDDDDDDDDDNAGDDDDDDDFTDTDTDWSTDTDTDWSTDTDDTTNPPCVPPNVALSTGTGSGSFDPWYVSVGLVGVLENGNIVDYTLDGTDATAGVIFSFYDSTVNPVCYAVFDASLVALPTGGTPTDTGLPLWDAWLLNLVASNGNTNCPLILGSQDVRSWVTAYQWGVGIGPMSATLAGELQSVLGTTEWNTNWAPHAFASYIYIDGLTGGEAWEMGFGFRYPHTCYDVSSTSARLSKPTGTFNAYFETGEFWVLDMYQM